MVVTAVITPVLQKAETRQSYQNIGGCYKGLIILQKSVLVRSISFKCILYVLEQPLCEETNKLELPLVLYIRLEL